MEDAECARHRPLESQVGPRLYTTSLHLHQPRLIPSTWRGRTTSRLPLPAHNAGDSSRPPDEGDAGVGKEYETGLGQASKPLKSPFAPVGVQSSQRSQTKGNDRINSQR
ncbi:hypothetical protein THAOC_19870, partial [Thalassiosira oceanica]